MNKIARDTVTTGASAFWINIHAMFPTSNQHGYIRYEYSPALLTEMRRIWFKREWQAHGIALRELRQRLEALAKAWRL